MPSHSQVRAALAKEENGTCDVLKGQTEIGMNSLLLTLVLAATVSPMSEPDPPLAPYRSAAHSAYTEEMVRADRPLCPDGVAPADFGACLDSSLKQAEQHLAAYRSALRSSIVARQKLLGSQSLAHFQAAERLWDLYSMSQLNASGDLADNEELAGAAEGESRIRLIRDHMRTLDRIYYILLHDDCGACLVDH